MVQTGQNPRAQIPTRPTRSPLFRRFVWGPDDYSIEHQVDTLKQAMERLNIARFDLGGLSYGGLVVRDMLPNIPMTSK